MRTYLHNILGTYTPTGDTFANADWEYLVSAMIIILTFWFLYKIIIAIFRS